MQVNNSSNISQMMLRYFSNANAMAAKSVRNIASGYRINSAADDASGLAIARKMTAQITGISAASQNAQDAVSMVQTADGVLGNVSDMAGRMNELATRAANGILGAEERQMLQMEYDQLAQEIDRVGQSTTFNGNKLFDGSSYTMQVGERSGDTLTVEMSEMSSAALGLAGADLSSAAGAGRAMSAIKNAVNSISKQRGSLGTMENGLKAQINSLDDRQYNTIESLSRIQDADIAKESINRSLANVLNQSSLVMMRNAQNLMPYSTLSLLMR